MSKHICSFINCELRSCSSSSYLTGRFLHYIHLDGWAFRVFFGNTSTRISPVGYNKVTHLCPWKGEKTLSLLFPLLPSYPCGLSGSFNWNGICCCCTAAAPIPHLLLQFRLRCLCKSGNQLIPYIHHVHGHVLPYQIPFSMQWLSDPIFHICSDSSLAGSADQALAALASLVLKRTGYMLDSLKPYLTSC